MVLYAEQSGDFNSNNDVSSLYDLYFSNNHRYYFISDVKGKSAKAMTKVIKRYNEVGKENTQYLEVQRKDDKARVDALILLRALDFIDNDS